MNSQVVNIKAYKKSNFIDTLLSMQVLFLAGIGIIHVSEWSPGLVLMTALQMILI